MSGFDILEPRGNARGYPCKADEDARKENLVNDPRYVKLMDKDRKLGDGL